MRDELKRLEDRRKQVLAMGGEKRVARQKERGKMTARERLEYLLDPGSLIEYGMHATHALAASRVDAGV